MSAGSKSEWLARNDDAADWSRSSKKVDRGIFYAVRILGRVARGDREAGIFCALYSGRASHFFVTPKAGGKIDPNQVTQLGRTLRELGIKMIPAYSPQARGRMERSYRSWQAACRKNCARAKSPPWHANRFLREQYLAEFNRRFAVAASQPGSAFVRTKRKDLEGVFSIQHERTVNQDNTIALDNRILQIDKTRWRNTLAGCKVTVYEHLCGLVVGRFGPHEVLVSKLLPCPPSKPSGLLRPNRQATSEPWPHESNRSSASSGGSASRPPGFSALLPSHVGMVCAPRVGP